MVTPVVGDLSGNGMGYRASGPYIINKTYLDEMGVVTGTRGNGAENSRIFNAILASGIDTIRLRRNELYRFASRIVLPNNIKLICDDSDAPATLFMDKSGFTNTSLATQLGANGCLLYARSVSNVLLEGFIVQSEVGDGRKLTGIYAGAVDTLTIRGIEMFGIPSGCGMSLDSVTGNSRIEDFYIHDFYDNFVWPSSPQTSAIEVDSNRLGGVNTELLRINNFAIKRITRGTSGAAPFGQQTGGIGLISVDPNTRPGRVIMSNGVITDTDQGLDIYSAFNDISNMVIRRCSSYGIALKHGAAYNAISNSSVTDCVRNCLVISGGMSAGDGAATGNKFDNMQMANANYDNSFVGAGSVVGFEAAGNATYAPQNNTISNSHLDAGPNGRFCWISQDAGCENNFGEGLELVAGGQSGAERIRVINVTNGGVRLAGGNGSYIKTLT